MKLLLVLCLGIMIQVPPAEGGLFDWFNKVHHTHIKPFFDSIFNRKPPATTTAAPTQATTHPTHPTHPPRPTHPTHPPTTSTTHPPSTSSPFVDDGNSNEHGVDIGDNGNPGDGSDDSDGSSSEGGTENNGNPDDISDDNDGSSSESGTGDSDSSSPGSQTTTTTTVTLSQSKCEKKGGECVTTAACPTCYKAKTRDGFCPTGQLCCMKKKVPKDWCQKRGGLCVSKDQCNNGGKASQCKCSEADKVCCTWKKADKKCTGKHKPCGATKCQMLSERCHGGGYVSGLCGGPIDRQCCVPGVNNYTNKFSHSEAVTMLNAEGIPVTSSRKPICNDRYNKKCTSLDGIRRECIKMIIEYKQMFPKCNFQVTGGTEVGHSCGTKSHYNGWKIDVSKKALKKCMADLKKYFTYIGLRSDNARLFKDPKGRVIAEEKKHYDITCAMDSNLPLP